MQPTISIEINKIDVAALEINPGMKGPSLTDAMDIRVWPARNECRALIYAI